MENNKQEYIPKDTRYEEWMCKKIIEVAETGGHVAKMCQEIGIKSRDTFYRWTREYPEFGAAYETAKLASQSFYENILLAGACGQIKNFNFGAIAMILNNKFPGDYSRGTGSGNNTEINIGSINSIEKMDSKELDAKIADLQKKLNILPVEEDELESDGSTT